jgi:hypothetical protein
MNSRFLTALTIATVTFLSFSSMAKAEDAAQPDVSAPEPTVVIQDQTQTTRPVRNINSYKIKW